MSQEHIKNGKKALSVVMNNRSRPYKLYVSTENLPSSMTMDDYYVCVRKKMFVLLNDVKPMIIQGVEGPGLQLPATSVFAIGDNMTTYIVETNGDDDNSCMSCNQSTRNSSLEGNVNVSSCVDDAHEDQLLITDEQGNIYDQLTGGEKPRSGGSFSCSGKTPAQHGG